jgi:uridine kinase
VDRIDPGRRHRGPDTAESPRSRWIELDPEVVCGVAASLESEMPDVAEPVTYEAGLELLLIEGAQRCPEAVAKVNSGQAILECHLSFVPRGEKGRQRRRQRRNGVAAVGRHRASILIRHSNSVFPMRGDQLLIEPHHRQAARGLHHYLREELTHSNSRHVITIAGGSGSGKSETAQALADLLEQDGIRTLIFQQDDYFVHPPRTNDRTRRADIDWVGPQEVRLDLMDEHLAAFKDGADAILKPLVDYAADRIEEERLVTDQARVAIAEGTYTTLLGQADWRAFINRTAAETRAHREKRARHASELDAFIERVLTIEHEIIASHRPRADFIIDSDYSVHPAEKGD